MKKKEIAKPTKSVKSLTTQKKNIKCSGKKRSKKNRFKNEGKRKIKTYVFDGKKNDSRQFLLIFRGNFPQ